MVELSKIDTKEFLSVVFKHEELRDKLYECIYNSEFNYLNEKLDCFNLSCADWSIDVYNSNYLCVKDSSGFLSCVQDSISKFGCSDYLQKMVDHAERLEGTNLFEYYVKVVGSIYFQEELQTTCDWLEDISFVIYCKDVEKFIKNYSLDSVKCLQDSFDGYVLNDETQEVIEYRRIA